MESEAGSSKYRITRFGGRCADRSEQERLFSDTHSEKSFCPLSNYALHNQWTSGQ